MKGTALWLAISLIMPAPVCASPFATQVLHYWPAPGQSIYWDPEDPDLPVYIDPLKALGAPQGGGTFAPVNEVVTLGAFGGSIVLKFDHRVTDDPHNPTGLDAIVFGNCHWIGGNPRRKWIEPAAIEISKDVNGNGLADDPWYVVRGSHTGAVPLSCWQSEEYDKTNPAYKPTNKLQYPDRTTVYGQTWFPDYPDHVTLSAYRVPDAACGVLINNSPSGSEPVWGYGECTPVLKVGDFNADNIVDDPTADAEAFYRTPDDPFAVGITPGSCGGDAFDIKWAVDAQGNPANLDGFDFIRLTTGGNKTDPLLGEISSEIDGAADVSQDYPIGVARALPVGTSVDLKWVKVVGAYVGELYVEEPDRSAGMKVKSSRAVTIGDVVFVFGQVQTNAGEPFVQADKVWRIQTGLTDMSPLTVPNNDLRPGMLMRTSGRVTQVGQGMFRISDGSFGSPGLLVSCEGLVATPPHAGQYVVVTGVVGVDAQAGIYLRLRGDEDISVVSEI